MYSIQLKKILKQDKFTKKYFIDVFPSDKLPAKIKNYPACLIANVDTSKEPGSHWVAFFLLDANRIEFFDSYGNTPEFFGGGILEFVNKFSHVISNPLILQSNVTAVCGQYCIYYLYSRCRGRTMKQIVSSFVTRHICNDKRVYNFVFKYFRVRTSFYQ